MSVSDEAVEAAAHSETRSMNRHHQKSQEALGFLEAATGSYIDPTTQALQTSQTEATLSLAYEQRTANLLAAFGLLGNYEEGETLLGERMDGLELAREIKERLGFEAAAPHMLAHRLEYIEGYVGVRCACGYWCDTAKQCADHLASAA